MIRKILCVSLFFIIGMVIPITLEGAEITASELIQGFRESGKWNSVFSMQIESEAWIDSHVTGHMWSSHTKSDFIYNRDKKRGEWYGKKIFLDEVGEIIPERSLEFVQVIAAGQEIRAERPGYRDKYEGRFEKDNEKRNESIRYMSKDGLFLEGVLGGIGKGAVLADIMGENSIVYSEQEVVDGINCFVLESETKYGKLKAWIAPEKGYNALKYTLHTDGDALFREKPIKESVLEEIVVEINNVKIENIGGKFVAVAGDYSKKSILKNGDYRTTKIKIKRNNIDLAPDFEAIEAFKPKIPDGTMMYNSESEAFRYQWFGGHPLLYVDDLVQDYLDFSVNQLADKPVSQDTNITTVKKNKDKTSCSSEKPTVKTENPKDNIRQPDTNNKAKTSSNKFVYLLIFLVIAFGIMGYLVYRSKHKNHEK